MRRVCSLIAAALTLLSGCQAKAQCVDVSQVAPPYPPVRFSADDLRAAVSRDVLTLWPGTAAVKLNQDFGLDIAFTDGTNCHTALAATIPYGIAVRSGTRRIRTVEAGICDDKEQMCTSVVLNLGR